jgi:hypothetical protein
MENKPQVYIGYNPSNHPLPFSWAVVDTRLRLVELSEGSLEEALACASRLGASSTAINSPASPNLSMVKQNGPRRGRKPIKPSHQAQNFRVAEYQLHLCGIRVTRTPSTLEDCPRWMQNGFDLHNGLGRMGFNSSADLQHQKLETIVEAAFQALLKQPLYPVRSLEGRLQRQIILFDLVVGMNDPMEFFEEVTRRRLLTGSLPTGCLYSLPKLHAIGAAYIAWLEAQKPGQIVHLGNSREGWVSLPEWEGFDRFKLVQSGNQSAII